MKRNDVVTKGWSDYELLDSGNLRKLERFGSMILDRPDPQAIWNKYTPELWENTSAQFLWKQDGERWSVQKGIEETWNIHCDEVVLKLGLSKFKHIGIFPEHFEQWQVIKEIVKNNPGIKVLNLFGYTGAISVIAAKLGALVTHVDASKQTIQTVKENAQLSLVPEGNLKTIVEDALKYVKRLSQREETFDVIILDPPAFGRGPKGEVWKIEEKLSELMQYIPSICSKNIKMVLLNGYAAGFSARSFGELLEETMKDFGGEVVYGDVGIKEKNTDRILSTGIYSMWKK
jgi:23S rRNA (cytosine1962-C5)-methyltransferase